MKKKCRTAKYEVEHCTNHYKSQDCNSEWKKQVAGNIASIPLCKRSKHAKQNIIYVVNLQQGKGIKNTKCCTEATC